MFTHAIAVAAALSFVAEPRRVDASSPAAVNAQEAPAPVNKDAAVVPTIQLPPGPLRAACARLTAQTEPAQVAEDLGERGKAPGISRAALVQAPTWERWHATLVALRAKEEPRARARLALIALEQGRYTSAWSHLERASASPEVLAALLPRFLPGVASGATLARGGRVVALPDGARLTPALPPAVGVDEPATKPSTTPTEPENAASPFAPARSMRTEFEIGAARVALSVALQNEGVQVELTHLSGGTARVSIVLPRAEDNTIATEYVDWFKQDTLGAPLEVVLEPESEPHVLFGRFEPRAPHWPTRVPDRLPAAIESGGLWLVVAPNDAEREFDEALARAFSFPELELACKLRTSGEPKSGGVEVDLTDVALRADKRAWLVSSVEALVLRR